MKQCIRLHKTVWVLICLFGMFLAAPSLYADLTLKNVYPTKGMFGQELFVTLTGTGYSGSTRLSMALDIGNKRSILGALALSGFTFDIELAGDRAYVLNGESGLSIVNIDDQSSQYLTVIDSIQTPGSIIVEEGDIWKYARGIQVVDGIAYIANGGSGFCIVDIDPQSPDYLDIRGSVSMSGNANFVDLINEKAYVGNGAAGLTLVNVSQVTNPFVVDSVPAPPSQSEHAGPSDKMDVYGVKVQGNYAYVTYHMNKWWYEGGLYVVNVNPSSPSFMTIVGNVRTNGRPNAVKVKDNYAFVSDRIQGLLVVDISNPANPWIVSTESTPGYAYNVNLVDDTAYISDWIGGISVIDITDENDPVLLGSVDTPGWTRSIQVSGSTAFCADGYSGLQVADLSEPSMQGLIGWADSPGQARFFDIVGDVLYLADGFEGLQVIDIGNPAKPEIIKEVVTPGDPRSVTISGNRAYVADYDRGVCILDISNTRNPLILGSNIDTTNAAQVTLSGNYAYVADGAGGLKVINLTTRSVVGGVPTSGWASDVKLVTSTYAYLCASSGDLKIINISNPSLPSIVKTVSLPGNPQYAVISGNFAYIAAEDNGLHVLDISDVLNPVLRGSEDTPDKAWHVTLVGNRAYVADGSGGLQVIDVSNPDNPATIGSADTLGGSICSAVQGDIAFVSDYSNGLLVVPIPIEIQDVNFDGSSTRLTATLPSPTLEGHYILRVFNSSESDELPGAVTFSDAVLPKVVIINMGYISGDNTSEGFQTAAKKAYKSLLFQGFRKEDIFFLSSRTDIDVDGNGLADDIDRTNNLDNIDYAINTWAVDQSPMDLIVYIVGHGSHSHYYPNGSEDLEVDDLDDWLDNIQNSLTGKLFVIYDACYSGSFIPKLKPPSNSNRITITSSALSERAYFLDQGEDSFSYEFWDAFSDKGGALAESLNTGKRKMKRHGQTPWLDANGNGIENEHADVISNIEILGRDLILPEVKPRMEMIAKEQSLEGETGADFSVRVTSTSDSPITTVQASIHPPGYYIESDAPVTDLPAITFQDNDQDGVYEGSYGSFSKSGTYKIVVKAKDGDDNKAETEAYVFKSFGSDTYEPDNTPSQAVVIDINDPMPQFRNFYESQDEDWVKFIGMTGMVYNIYVSGLGPNCDAVIEIYAESDPGVVLDQENYLGDPGASELLGWRCTQDGVYLVRIRPADPVIQGKGTDYSLVIYDPTAPYMGELTGFVTDAITNQPIAGAQITTNGGGAAFSIPPSGRYRIIQPSGGNIVATVTADGYQSDEKSQIEIGIGGETQVDFQLTPENTDPVASIDSPASSVIIREGETVNFQGSVTGGTPPFEYLWDFNGGAANSSLVDPGYVAFQSVGTYNVSFSVEDDEGRTHSDYVVITVEEAPDTDGDGDDDNIDTNDDNDGLPDTEEQGPDGNDTGYDGNGDDIADRLQKNVVSLHSYDTLSYVTLAAPAGTTISDCQAVENPSPSTAPSGISFPMGFFEFTIEDVGNGGSASLEMYFPNGATFNTYYKHGVTPNNPLAHWYEFIFDNTTGAAIAGSMVTLYFVDALRGDDKLVQEGKIIDVGGPGTDDTKPTATITSPDSDKTINKGESLDFQGSVTGGNAPFTYLWDFNGGADNSSVEDPGPVAFNNAGSFSVTFNVTDADGDESNDSLAIQVQDNSNGGSSGGGGGGGGGCFIRKLHDF